ncbi:hypothetical protein LC048_24550 [Mesobacillus subterraneus]|uniref:hypothetical protein n=1 Tax=Mesobacillus subterraneus TaxID=285983 RepID=UPI001CFD6569|nr:hypothetical protein [Mesobacillus subterraneus]WLR55394.1 hypothetical protein LC048_24550 [Mesobacillus subterraneus]
MGTISGKILSTMLSASIVTTAVGYTGGQYMDTIKSNIDTVTLKATLLNDEAATKIEMANELLQQKNKDLSLLKEKLDRLNQQLNEANDKLARLEKQQIENQTVEKSSGAYTEESEIHTEQEIHQTTEESEAPLETTEDPVISDDNNDESQEIIVHTGGGENTGDSGK